MNLPRQSKLPAAASLLGASLLIFGYLWWGRFEYLHGGYLAAVQTGVLVLILGNHWYYRDGRRQLGLRIDNLARALRRAAPPTLLLGLLILAGGWAAGEFRLDRWSDLGIYLPWALLQQYALQNFLVRRFQTLWNRAVPAALCASLLFAAFHLPNLPLVLMTFLGALFWCRLFRQVPNLFSVSLSHAALAGLLLVTFKFGLLNQLEIGSPGRRYDTFGDGVQVAAGHCAEGEAFIATLPGQNAGKAPLVRLFRPDGRLFREWFAFSEAEFSGNLAVGDLGYGSGDEVVVSMGPAIRNPPLVGIFSCQGEPLLEFEAGTGYGYGAGVTISRDRITVTPGPAPGAPARVLQYDPAGLLEGKWEFPGTGFRNGIQAMLWPSGSEGGEDLWVLWGTAMAGNPSRIRTYDKLGNPVSDWDVYGTTYGLEVARMHLGEAGEGILTAPGPLEGYPPHLKVFDSSGGQLYDFFAYEEPAACGSNLSAIDIDGDGVDEVILGEGTCHGRRPTVRIVNLRGDLLETWEAY